MFNLCIQAGLDSNNTTLISLALLPILNLTNLKTQVASPLSHHQVLASDLSNHSIRSISNTKEVELEAACLTSNL